MKLRKKAPPSKAIQPDEPKLHFHHAKSERDAWERAHRGDIDPQLGTQRFAIFDDAPTASSSAASPPLALPNPAVVAARERMIASLPSSLWEHVASYLDPADAAVLSLASKTLLWRLDWRYLDALRRPENQVHAVTVLVRLDGWYPTQLFCFQCNRYHRRLRPGAEQFKADYVLNPLFDCPSVLVSRLPRMRLVHGRELPYAFVQLACRARRFSPAYGIDPDSLARRWKCRDSPWSHRSRFLVHHGHLLLRVTSTCIAPPGLTATGERMLLFTREDYEPYFSACAHWRDGELMKVCKCAVGHIPPPQTSLWDQALKDGKGPSALSLQATRMPTQIVRGCGDCAPIRRCPECPSEYLVEIRMVEDKSGPRTSFKHALVVTRWSDLGDGTSPVTSTEWAACQGQAQYPSFDLVGNRAISGVFESEVSGAIPGARVVSLNPGNKKKDENSNTWY